MGEHVALQLRFGCAGDGSSASVHCEMQYYSAIGLLVQGHTYLIILIFND